ncbi:MAG TPA: VOC family protein, partial [Pilimelia sp.]|nr:VOC family protein [Pilimelia sp.]
MSDEVAALLPFVYVRDVARSVEFYRLLGFDRQAGGADDTWRWAYLAAGTAGLIVASDGTPPAADPGPALLYVSVADLGAALGRLAEAGVAAEHLGYPDHAPGGEARVADPDNHGLI